MNRKSIRIFLFLIALVPLIGCGGANYTPSVKDSSAIQVGGEIARAQEQEIAGIRFLADYRQGVETARRESKPVLLFFSLQDCKNSQRMRETTFCDTEIKRLADRFVCVSIDGAADADLCESFKVKNFPTTLILSTQGTEMQRLSGKQTSEELALPMHVAIQSTAFKSVPAVRK